MILNQVFHKNNTFIFGSMAAQFSFIGVVSLLDKKNRGKEKSGGSNFVAFLLIIIIIGLFILLMEEYQSEPERASVYIQAGHEGRVFGNTGSVSPMGGKLIGM